MVSISYSLRSLFRRRASSAAAAIGIALVVFVMGGTQMLSGGVQSALARTGHADQLIVMRSGADTEMASAIDRMSVPLIADSSFVQRDAEGRPRYVAELSMVLSMPKATGALAGATRAPTGNASEHELANVQLRGVPRESFTFHRDVRLVAGRLPQPGTDEVVIGQGLLGRFRGFEVGQAFPLCGRREATVVGAFEAGAGAFESEVWADIETVGSCFGRESIVTSVTLRLADPSAWRQAVASLEGDKRLGVQAARQDMYYETQSEGTSTFVGALGSAIVFFLAIAASIGAMVTLVGSAQQRRGEIGVLRALGFAPGSVLLSFLTEAAALSVVGAALGCLGCLLLASFDFTILNSSTWSQVTFAPRASAPTLLGATVLAVVLGLIGGLIPAVRAARTSPVNAMRRH